MRSIIVLVIVLTLFSIKLFSQVKVNGEIKDIDTKEPLVGANMKITNTYKGCYSNVEGKYIIKEIKIIP